jgi:hypothetical protein
MLKENYQRVKDLLITKPETRDNDNLLLSIIWGEDIEQVGEFGSKYNVFLCDFLKHLAKGELTNAESVRRVRQKIQEQCPELRGKNYRLRCGQLELEVKQEVKEISNYEKWHGTLPDKESIIKEGDLFRE